MSKAKKRTPKKKTTSKRVAPARRAVAPIPPGHPVVSPYLIVAGAANALAFYKQAFGAKELMRHAGPDGRIGHAEVRIGDSVIMLADEHPEVNARSPKAFGGSPVRLHVYVKDVDAVARQAIGAGAKTLEPVQDKFYGDRNGTLQDPFGHEWHISTHIEDVSPAEMRRRAAQMGQ